MTNENMTNGYIITNDLFYVYHVSLVQTRSRITMEGHQGDYQKIADDYLEWFGKNYSHMKNKYRTFCKLNNYTFDEDIFSDTYLKIYETIRRNGLKDATPQGFDNYTFLSFRTNIKREKQYARVTHRVMLDDDQFHKTYEEWYEAKGGVKNKLMRDLFVDFAVLYIIHAVEENFDTDHFYVYRLKMLYRDMTYKKLADTTKIKGARNMVIAVQKWVKENITKEQVLKAFYDTFGELLDE